MRERGSPGESASRIGGIISWPCGGEAPIIKGGFAVAFSPGDSGWIWGRNPRGIGVSVGVICDMIMLRMN